MTFYKKLTLVLGLCVLSNFADAAAAAGAGDGKDGASGSGAAPARRFVDCEMPSKGILDPNLTTSKELIAKAKAGNIDALITLGDKYAAGEIVSINIETGHIVINYARAVEY